MRCATLDLDHESIKDSASLDELFLAILTGNVELVALLLEKLIQIYDRTVPGKQQFSTVAISSAFTALVAGKGNH
jgi:hypothetical protein